MFGSSHKNHEPCPIISMSQVYLLFHYFSLTFSGLDQVHVNDKKKNFRPKKSPLARKRANQRSHKQPKGKKKKNWRENRPARGKKKKEKKRRISTISPSTFHPTSNTVTHITHTLFFRISDHLKKAKSAKPQSTNHRPQNPRTPALFFLSFFFLFPSLPFPSLHPSRTNNAP
jgi:hypothetical protein